MPPPAHLREVGEAVSARLAAFLAAERARWVPLEPVLAEPVDLLAAFVRGGKRIRPAFCHWGHAVASATAPSPVPADVVGAGAALEMLHAFALVHDDVMDGSRIRRGAPTVHVALAAGHRSRGWAGDPERYGAGAAVLVGDMAFVYADVLLGEVGPEARGVFHDVRTELNVGQYLDLTAAARRDGDLAMVRRIARYKTGSYTVERPLHLGAALAGRLHELAEPLSAYGRPLGEVFQLRDDVLGAFGDADVTGKPVGDDFREGKVTALVAEAATRADPAGRAVLAGLGHQDLDDADVDRIRDVLVDTGAVGAVESSIAALHGRAVDALADPRLAAVPTGVRALAELADYVAWRDR